MDYAIVRKILVDCMRLDREDYPRTKVLTVAHDNDRSLFHHGKFYSPLIDTIEDDLGKRGVHCVSIARIISTIKGQVAHGRVYSPEGRFARALIQKRLLALVKRGRYPFSIPEEKAWGSILDKTGAEKVFGILPSRELCAACKKRGVWVADVQHGVIAESHPWYGEAFRRADPPEFLPNAFLCWDAGSEAVLSWTEAKQVRTHVIGNRWLARFVNRSEDDELVRELLADHPPPPDPLNRPTILLSLSWGEENIPNGFIAPSLEAVIQGTSSYYRWLIRLHPNQLRGFATHEGPKFLEYFNLELAGSAEWEWPTRAPLPLVLSEIDLHVSWQSSVAIEAAQMGVKTALLNPRLRLKGANEDYYGFYRASGMVDLVDENEQAIAEWVTQNVKSKRTAEAFERYDAEYRRFLDFVSA